MKEMTLYAITRAGQVTGVFTTEEAARTCKNAEVSPLTVLQLPGSPELRGWVAAARGKWTSLSMDAQGVQSQTFRPGPCWGVNVQTAVAGIFAPGGDLRRGCIPRNAELTSLRLYELDRDYGAQCPDNLALVIFAGQCVSQLRQSGRISGEALGEDLIALHERYEQGRREKQARMDSGLPELLAEHLLAVACARAPGKRGFCGTYLTRVARDLDSKVARCFTLRELKILGALLKRKDGWAERMADIDLSDMDLTAVPEEEMAELRARLDKLTPPVRRTAGVRHDDEDPAEIARWILHPETMVIDGAEIDIPEPPEE